MSKFFFIHKNIILITTILFCSRESIHAKKDESIKDNSSIEKIREHPRVQLMKDTKIRQQRAMLYSMILPCGGQIYNKTYWTACVFTTVAGLATWWTIYWNNKYVNLGINQLKNTEQMTNDSLKGTMTTSKRNRDLGFIALGVTYVLSIVEAYVTASLGDFDISDDLSFTISPTVKNNNPGIEMGLKIKP